MFWRRHWSTVLNVCSPSCYFFLFRIPKGIFVYFHCKYLYNLHMKYLHGWEKLQPAIQFNFSIDIFLSLLQSEWKLLERISTWATELTPFNRRMTPHFCGKLPCLWCLQESRVWWKEEQVGHQRRASSFGSPNPSSKTLGHCFKRWKQSKTIIWHAAL